MRIDLNAGLNISESKVEGNSALRRDESPQKGEAQGAADRITVASLSAPAFAAPEVRLDKVAALRAQIAAGTYQVPSEQISAAMLDQLANWS